MAHLQCMSHWPCRRLHAARIDRNASALPEFEWENWLLAHGNACSMAWAHPCSGHIAANPLIIGCCRFVPRPGVSSLSRWRTVMTAMRLVLADHPLIGGLFFVSRKLNSSILAVPRQYSL